ncbi:hypothetical protein ONZ51_g4591 [Trametes cubensis]|uniref:Uncharacterized protein n=1 Tax=Trametes cubensis TaxID=1111947 RepID=A0AAD7TVJ8_9APHY|nr:hypothetical protein ONZ51_g4591 [Trametes cubensis]
MEVRGKLLRDTEERGSQYACYARRHQRVDRQLTREILPRRCEAGPESISRLCGSQGGQFNTEAIFAQTDSTAGAALKFNVVGSPSGAIGISVTSGSDALDVEFARKCIDAYTQGLMALVNPDRTVVTGSVTPRTSSGCV